ncbi:MAG: hypothetical protein M1548_05510, partial [Actinobacteria bacterium]|nr:hypothetical protein [Actinomycetota bacterium]
MEAAAGGAIARLWGWQDIGEPRRKKKRSRHKGWSNTAYERARRTPRSFWFETLGLASLAVV